jgi:hypothetical protein
MASGDWIELAGALVVLVREGEIDAAERRVAASLQDASLRSVEARRDLVHELNRQIALLKAQKGRVIAEMEGLEPSLRFEARHRLTPLLDELFAQPLAELKKQKRKVSRARGAAVDSNDWQR